jgi:DNA-binding response OmpR family regulator
VTDHARGLTPVTNSSACMPPSRANTPLLGARILLVEDDHLLAADLSAFLADQGAIVLGPAPTPFYALSLLGRRGADAAVLDVRLHGTDVFDVAAELVRRGIPMVFATALPAEDLPLAYRRYPVVQKPFDAAHLVHTIRRLLARPIMPEPTVPLEKPKDDPLMRAVVSSTGGNLA